MQPWFTVYFSDIGHPCYDQLIPAKTRYLLTADPVIHDYNAGSGFSDLKDDKLVMSEM